MREDLERRHRELGRQQNELGRQQDVLGRRQGELGKQPEKASPAAKSKLAALFEEAMENGTAKRMHF